MLKIKCLNNEKGVALITSIMLLSLLTIIGFSAMNSSDIELRIAGNERAATQAFNLAEAGIDHAFAQLKTDFVIGTFSSFEADYKDALAVYPVADSGGAKKDVHTLGSGKYTVFLKYINDMKITLMSEGFDVGNSIARVEVETDLKQEVSSAFKAGMLAHGSIGINGKSTFGGSIHTNSFMDLKNEFDLDASGDVVDRTYLDENGDTITISSYVTLVGDATKGKIDPSDRLKIHQDPITVPSASDHIDIKKDGAIKNVLVENLPTDGERNTYYFEGDITLSGDYTNITIMASGNITHNGSATLGAKGEVTVALISGGDIIFNGSSSTNALFWSEGDYLHNGSSSLTGAVVAGGTITSNGGLTYVQIDEFSGIDLDKENILTTSSWRQL